MSGGSTFSDVTLLVKPIEPTEAVMAFLRVKRQARDEHWTRDQARDALEAIGLLPYESAPGYVNGHKPRRAG